MSTTQDFDSLVGTKYDDLTAAQKAQLKASYDQQVTNYNTELPQSAADYRGLVNEATATSAMQEKARKESLANMGLSAAGGTSLSLAQFANNNLANQVGSINLQQQQYNDEVESALASLENQYNADVLNVDATVGAQKLTDQMSYNQWQSEYDLQQQQMEVDQETTKMNYIYELFLEKRITKKQFEELTGIDL